MHRNEEIYRWLALTVKSIQREMDQVLKGFGITEPQYQALCILKSAAPAALSCGKIAEGMISPDPDITRMLNRLERSGLLKRDRGGLDRRQVSARLTEEGFALLDKLEAPMTELKTRLLAGIDAEKAQEFLRSIHSRPDSIPLAATG